MKKYLLSCLAALATLMVSCSESALDPAALGSKTDPLVSVVGLQTPTPMTRSEVLRRAGVMPGVATPGASARVSAYLSDHPDFYKDRDWRLAEYEVNQPWVDKFGNPHAASSCWVGAVMRFGSTERTPYSTQWNDSYRRMYLTNVCGIGTWSALSYGFGLNDLRYLSEQDEPVYGNSGGYSDWSSAAVPGFLHIRRYSWTPDATTTATFLPRPYIVEVWEGGHLFLIRTDSHNGQFCYEKYHYVQQ